MNDHSTPPLYFLHIPRTGGTTLKELIASRFPGDSCLLAGSRRRFAEVMDALGPREKKALRFVSAHWDTSVTRLLGRAPRFVTMLREPVDRLRSHWDIVARMPEHRLHEEVRRGMSFGEWLAHEDGGWPERNRMTRQIAGAMDGELRARPADDPTLLDIAQDRLEEFAFFGIREAYDDSVRLLAKTFGWPPFAGAPRRNATIPRAVPPAERAAAEEANALDVNLYRFARTLFRERVTEAARSARPEAVGLEQDPAAPTR